MTSKLHKVFVYGTLKKGEPNHNYFTKSKNGYHKFICDAVTLIKYPLIIGTKYNIPFLLHSPGVGNHIVGEVYEVDDAVFADLDVLEDYPKWYTREVNVVKSMAVENEQHEAWIYLIKNFKPELLTQAMFNCYKSAGDHGQQYIPSEINESTDEDIYKIIEK